MPLPACIPGRQLIRHALLAALPFLLGQERNQGQTLQALRTRAITHLRTCAECRGFMNRVTADLIGGEWETG